MVFFVLAVLAAMLLPALSKAKRRGSHVSCAGLVKQICISSLVWAGDHNGKYPIELSVAEGGTKELAATGDVVTTFQIMSNELSTPKVLICWTDTDHLFATNFSTGFSAKNISYFIGLDASTNSPSTFLSGDDNFTITGGPAKSGLFNVASNAPITWTAARHHFSGNIGLSDGSVQSLANSNLVNQFNQTGLATNRLAIP